MTSLWNDQLIADAWKPCDFSADRPFDQQMAEHLMRRAAFGGTSTESSELSALGIDGAIERLFSPPGASDFHTEADLMIRTSLVLGDSTSIIDWWLYRMLSDPFSVREKAAFFWHGHFCTSRDKVPDAQLLLAQNNLLRDYSLGSFANMVKAVSRDAAMLVYLDSTENRKNRPNENYARELLELFCLGIGNYNEQDIKELARCFTGWEVRRRRFRISRSDHDNGVKTVLGTSGSLGGDDAIDIILQHPAAAKFIASKLIRFYVTDDEVPANVIKDLAQQLIDGQWQIAPVLQTIFRSRLFYSNACIGRKVAGPVEWTVGWLRILETSSSFEQLRTALEAMGQVPLEPPNVKGWAAGTNWIDPSRMAVRVNWVQLLATELINPQGGLPACLNRNGLNSADDITNWVASHLVAGQLAPKRQEILHQQVLSQQQLVDQFRTAIQVSSLLPEAHLI